MPNSWRYDLKSRTKYGHEYIGLTYINEVTMSKCKSCNRCKKPTFDNDKPFELAITINVFPNPLNPSETSMFVKHVPTGIALAGNGPNRLALQQKLLDELRMYVQEYMEYGSIEDPNFFTRRDPFHDL